MAVTVHVTPQQDLQKVFSGLPQGAQVILAPGTYRQKLVIRTPGLRLQGAGAEQTRIVWDDYALKKDEALRDYITFRTYTLAVCADNVTIRDLSIVNDAGEPAKKGQQVALSVLGNGFTMSGCTLSSTQDTLFLGPLPEDLILRYQGLFPRELLRGGALRQRLENCRIEGSVDFIFGAGEAVLENCLIHSVFDGRATGFVAAPAHGPEQSRGFTFRGCRFTAQSQVAPGSVYLARPWRDYGITCLENCSYGAHIAPEGFDKWNGTRRDLTARFSETPAREGRVSWINKP